MDGLGFGAQYQDRSAQGKEARSDEQQGGGA